VKTKTEEIFELSCPYNNPYQGSDFKALFVCSAGLLRSPTGANLFAKRGWNTRSCGTEDFALIRLSKNLIAWADKIYFVNKENYNSALFTFRQHEDALETMKRKAVVLSIEDSFPYNNPELIRQLEEKINAKEVEKEMSKLRKESN
jgi:predicted protein tyrosine phosphatase